MPNWHGWHSIDANRMCHTTERCQNGGRCRNPELNLSCRGIVCNSLVMQTSTRICKVIFSHFCNCLAIANYRALGLTHQLEISILIEIMAFNGNCITSVWAIVMHDCDDASIDTSCWHTNECNKDSVSLNTQQLSRLAFKIERKVWHATTFWTQLYLCPIH